MVYTVPVYFQVPVRLAVGSLLLILGLIGVYSLIHIVVSRRIVPFGPCLGAVVAAGLVVALYVAGASGSPILGCGKGQLAAVTFLGVSLVVAGLRATPGCELMAIPGVLFRKDTELACLIFSPPSTSLSASCETNATSKQSLQLTQHFVATTENVRTLVFKVLDS
jgi:hypothetical protein